MDGKPQAEPDGDSIPGCKTDDQNVGNGLDARKSQVRQRGTEGDEQTQENQQRQPGLFEGGGQLLGFQRTGQLHKQTPLSYKRTYFTHFIIIL